MDFNLTRSIEILERTPDVLISLLQNLSSDWTTKNEGGETWSAYDVVGHLIHGERTDWTQRLEIILAETGDKKFKVFDRFAQFHESKGKSLEQLLKDFKEARKKNVEFLKSKNLTVADENKKGIHPTFGEVTLAQLLSTWTAHDLGHIAQICRVMAKQYKEAVGPWIAYMRVMN